MTTTEKRRKTIRSIVRLIWGRCLTMRSPTPYGRLAANERQALLLDHHDAIERDVEAIMSVVQLAQEAGAAEVYRHIRKADAVDAEAIDEIMESSLEHGRFPVQTD